MFQRFAEETSKMSREHTTADESNRETFSQEGEYEKSDWENG